MGSDAARQVVLTGPVSRLAMPQVCIHCSEPPEASVPRQKVFERNYTDSPRSYVVDGLMVPLCPGCLAVHQAEETRLTAFQRFLLCFRTGTMFGAICTAAMAGFLFWLAVRDGDSNSMSLLFFGGLGAFFLVVTWATYRAAYSETRHLAVPPPTSVLESFDFSDDQSELFDGSRHTYTLRNPRFADAFVELNRDRVWDSTSPRAERAGKARNLLVWALVIAGVLLVLWDAIKPQEP